MHIQESVEGNNLQIQIQTTMQTNKKIKTIVCLQYLLSYIIKLCCIIGLAHVGLS